MKKKTIRAVLKLCDIVDLHRYQATRIPHRGFQTVKIRALIKREGVQKQYFHSWHHCATREIVLEAQEIVNRQGSGGKKMIEFVREKIRKNMRNSR